MSVRNLKDGSKKPWICECYPNGREGKRVRKRFATKGEANAFELHTLKNVDNKPWLGEKVDNRRLSEIIQLWYDLHGRLLTRHKVCLTRLTFICEHLGNPIASKLTINAFAKFRQKRLNGEIENGKPKKAAVKPVTINHDQKLLISVYNELKKLGEIDYPNPLAGLKLFKIEDNELSFLSHAEIPIILDACRANSFDLYMIAKICLATGCRWSEAENLKNTQIASDRITFIKTKGKKNRTIPVSPELINELPKVKGRLFSACGGNFRYAVKRAGLDLAEGQMTHVLRHTFASHFMMNGGNILVLQNILGHADIQMTMRYAHFAPSHLEDAVTKNPLATLSKSGDKMATFI
ncbi:MAG: phage integrase [Parashewanella sp.]